MKQTLVLAGIGIVVAALVGGGVKLSSIEVPTFKSLRRQMLLGVFGVFIFLVGLGSTDEKPGDPPPSSPVAMATVAGEGSQSASCVAFAPCGGDVVGTWELTRVCPMGKLAPIDGCPNAVVTYTNLRAKGRAHLTSDHEYEVETTIDFDGDVILPLECLHGGDCNALTGVLSASLPGATCALAGARCECHFRANGMTDFDRGTYSLMDTRIASVSRMKDEPPSPPDEYCVAGDVLRLRSNAGALPAVMVFKRAR